jgi:hypothetical protein
MMGGSFLTVHASGFCEAYWFGMVLGMWQDHKAGWNWVTPEYCSTA